MPKYQSRLHPLKVKNTALQKGIVTVYLVAMVATAFFFKAIFLDEEKSREKPNTQIARAVAQKRIVKLKIPLRPEEKKRIEFKNTIEQHYQKLVNFYEVKSFNEASDEIALFRQFGELEYKDVESLETKIKVARLEEQAEQLPESNLSGKLQIYKHLFKLEPNNPDYRRKVILLLEEKVKPIPASQVSENLRIYRQLLTLEPDNPRYKKKVTFYKLRLRKQNQEAGHGKGDLKHKI